MLTEPEQLLISAAVDGELTPAEVEAFDHLLAENPEAGRLYNRWKENAARLAALPKRNAPPTLAATVMARVRPVTPARKPVPARRSLLPFAVAASLFLAVSAASFFFFNTPPTPREQARTEQLPPPGRSVVAPVVRTAEPAALAKVGVGRDGLSKPSVADGAVAKLPPVEPPPVVVVQGPRKFTPEEKELLASALMIESKPLKQIDPVLPLLYSALEFDTPDAQTRLKKDLASDGGFRLNLFTKNTATAAEQVAAAARGVGVNVFTEGATAERLKKGAPLAYAVYTDSLTADQLAALFGALSKRVNAQPHPETTLGPAHFVPADVNEEKDLKELIGLDWPEAVTATPAEGKSVSDGTLGEVVTSMKKTGECTAVVLTYAARQFAARTPEVKQYFEKRGDRKPGTVPLLIVIRPQP